MRHVPGLDGLRAIAVVVVVLFHGDVTGFSGGFLGVSLFFTLSGFLITTLLLDEYARTGDVSLRRFYTRRVRRLLPAASLCLLLVAAWGGWWGVQQQRALPGDLVASVANVANWRFAFSDTSYADLLSGSAPSPVAHFWSLAIEEQVYLVLPVVLLLAMRRGRRVVTVTISLLLALSVTATLLTDDRDLIYNGTHTRAAEVLVGCALALFLAGRRLPDGSWRPVPGVTRTTGTAALVAFVVLVALGSVDQAWIYRGGLPLVGVLSAVMIAAVATDRLGSGGVRPLDARPLVAVGAVSYGIYLFHWPVFLLLDPARTGLDGVALLALRCGVTAALTLASYRLVEQPVRTGLVARRTPAVFALVGAATAAVLVATSVAVPRPEPTHTEQILALGVEEVVEFEPPVTASRLRSARSSPAADDDTPTAGQPPTTEAPAPARVLVIGSDPGAAVELGGVAGIEVVDGVRPECLLVAPAVPGCVELADHAASLRARHDPAVVVIAAGAGEAAVAAEQNAAATGFAELEALGALHEAVTGSLLRVIDDASAAGAAVVLSSGAGASSPFHARLTSAAVLRPAVLLADGAGTLAARVDEALDSTTATANGVAPLRLLVIGDSTSLSLAQAFNAGGDGALEVLWAGANGCPFASVTSIRSTAEQQWRAVDCTPYDVKLPPLIDSFRPDALFLMSGPLEQVEQRYPGSDDGHVAGDVEFAAARDTALVSLLDTVGPTTPVLVADFPQVAVGKYATEEMRDPARLLALNDQVAAWDDRWDQVVRFDYRARLEAAEAAHGTLRSDGVHPDALQVEGFARSTLAPQLLGQVEALRRALAASTIDGE